MGRSSKRGMPPVVVLASVFMDLWFYINFSYFMIMISFTRYSSVVALLSLLCRIADAASSCYFPNGDVASNYVPCSPTGDGDCCASGDFCTQWGFCISNSKGYHYRGACTDSSWFNPSCPDYCLADTNSGNSSIVNIIACDAAPTSGTWCCAYDGNCCNNTSSLLTPVFGIIFAEGQTISSSTSASTSSSTSVPASTTSSPAVASTSSSLPTQTSTTSSAGNSSSHKSTVVGVAVGVPLGVIALAGLALFYLERRRRRNSEAQQQPQQYPPSGDEHKFEYFGGARAGDPTNNSVPGAPTVPSTTYILRVEAEAGIAAAEAEAEGSQWGQRTGQKYELSSVPDSESPTQRHF